VIFSLEVFSSVKSSVRGGKKADEAGSRSGLPLYMRPLWLARHHAPGAHQLWMDDGNPRLCARPVLYHRTAPPGRSLILLKLAGRGVSLIAGELRLKKSSPKDFLGQARPGIGRVVFIIKAGFFGGYRGGMIAPPRHPALAVCRPEDKCTTSPAAGENGRLWKNGRSSD